MQVLAVIDRADAWQAVDFLNKRGGNVKFGKIAAPPSEDEWSKKGLHPSHYRTFHMTSLRYHISSRADPCRHWLRGCGPSGQHAGYWNVYAPSLSFSQSLSLAKSGFGVIMWHGVGHVGAITCMLVCRRTLPLAESGCNYNIDHAACIDQHLKGV